MDLAKVLQQLKQDLANLDAAIASLERLQQVNQRRTQASEPEEKDPAPEPPARKSAAKKAGRSKSKSRERNGTKADSEG